MENIENQILDLKSYLFNSKEINDLAKTIWTSIVNASDNVTEQVYFVLNLMSVTDDRYLDITPIKNILDEKMNAIGTDLRFFYERHEYISIFYLLKTPIPIQCDNIKRISEQYVTNTKLK